MTVYSQDIRDAKYTIGFHYINLFGHEFSAESKTDYDPEYGESELSMIGDCMNHFLRQIGFYRRNDYMLMDDLTEEELDALTEYLHRLRAADSMEDTDALCE